MVSVVICMVAACCNSKGTCKVPDLQEGDSEVCVEEERRVVRQLRPGGGDVLMSPTNFTRGLRLSLDWGQWGEGDK